MLLDREHERFYLLDREHESRRTILATSSAGIVLVRAEVRQNASRTVRLVIVGVT